MTPKQQQYLAELARTGSAVHARRAVGITRRQVSNWEQDEAFAEAAAEAQELANAEILSKAREQAMAGDTSLLSTWMRALIPALRPQSSVQVGVAVGHSRAAQLSDEALIAKAQRVLEDVALRESLQTRRMGAGGVVDAEVLPSAMPESEGLSGPEIKPEDLL